MVVAGGMEKWLGIVHVLYFYSAQQFFVYFCLLHLLLFIRSQSFVDSLAGLPTRTLPSLVQGWLESPYCWIIEIDPVGNCNWSYTWAYIPGGVNQCLHNWHKFTEIEDKWQFTCNLNNEVNKKLLLLIINA